MELIMKNKTVDLILAFCLACLAISCVGIVAVMVISMLDVTGFF
ncbi:hypothetical protein Motto_51 [Pseudomonas phage Motto]|nr:hypothetical protein Motto_51 [Pseudomonas phage Motto]